MALAASAPRVLARVVCVLSLASARGRHGLASAAPFATASRQCPPRPPPRARRACSPKAATARDGGSADPGGAFEVHPVAGDGRCLFRSVAVAMALRDGGARPTPAEETREADRLREAAVDDLERRREEVEWFIEGDFEAYCTSMRRTRAWGGEPEILSLARVLGRDYAGRVVMLEALGDPATSWIAFDVLSKSAGARGARPSDPRQRTRMGQRQRRVASVQRTSPRGQRRRQRRRRCRMPVSLSRRDARASSSSGIIEISRRRPSSSGNCVSVSVPFGWRLAWPFGRRL